MCCSSFSFLPAEGVGAVRVRVCENEYERARVKELPLKKRTAHHKQGRAWKDKRVLAEYVTKKEQKCNRSSGNLNSYQLG